MGFPNPFLIQKAPRGAHRAPLVLIHDGGGTIFSYFKLAPLGRAVYGIHNSRPAPDGKWEGGLRQMAEEYYALIKSVIPQGPVIIGGWSLGGLVSLEIAQLAAEKQDSALQILGLVMIDSRYPRSSNLRQKILLPPDTKPSIRDMIEAGMVQSRELIGNWSPPLWQAGTSPPPTILLRAAESLPDPETDESGHKAETQIVPSSRPLGGWEDCGYDFIVKAVEIKGNHFSIFDDQHIAGVNQELNAACTYFERRT